MKRRDRNMQSAKLWYRSKPERTAKLVSVMIITKYTVEKEYQQEWNLVPDVWYKIT